MRIHFWLFAHALRRKICPALQRRLRGPGFSSLPSSARLVLKIRALSRCESKKFERALSMPALLISSHDLQANSGNDDDDVDPRFGIRGKSVSGHTERSTGLCQISRNRVGVTTSENKISLSLPE